MVDRLVAHTKVAVSALLRTMHSIKVGTPLRIGGLGEGFITPMFQLIQFLLTRKGICLDIAHSSNAQWHKWMHPLAPNARLV